MALPSSDSEETQFSNNRDFYFKFVSEPRCPILTCIDPLSQHTKAAMASQILLPNLAQILEKC
jgi:hypothetical protein